MNKYYLIGIKGSGMSALACYLYDLGHIVVGSDVIEDFGFSDNVKERNINVLTFSKTNITNEYIYIVSAAYDESSEELNEVIKRGYKYWYYHDFISTLPGKHIAICGTHGKTTTTAMIKDLLINEPIAYIIGDGTGKAQKDYQYLIYEACEYQEHFLAYNPDLLIINHIELDHPDYYRSFDEVVNAFKKFAKKAKTIITKASQAIYFKNNELITFGEKGKYIIKKQIETPTGYLVEINNEVFELPFFGKHMVDNFLSAYVTVKELGYSDDYIKANIKNIKMPKRRMTEYSLGNSILIDDYAHHPTEIRALFDSISQKYPAHTKNVIFQPHTYSRTLALSDNFNRSLALFDKVYIAPTFTSKREAKDEKLQKQVDYIFQNFSKFEPAILNQIDPNERAIWLFLGAGNIDLYLLAFLNNR